VVWHIFLKLWWAQHAGDLLKIASVAGAPLKGQRPCSLVHICAGLELNEVRRTKRINPKYLEAGSLVESNWYEVEATRHMLGFGLAE
jgi:hypothetical protein